MVDKSLQWIEKKAVDEDVKKRQRFFVSGGSLKESMSFRRTLDQRAPHTDCEGHGIVDVGGATIPRMATG